MSCFAQHYHPQSEDQGQGKKREAHFHHHFQPIQEGEEGKIDTFSSSSSLLESAVFVEREDASHPHSTSHSTPQITSPSKFLSHANSSTPPSSPVVYEPLYDLRVHSTTTNTTANDSKEEEGDKLLLPPLGLLIQQEMDLIKKTKAKKVKAPQLVPSHLVFSPLSRYFWLFWGVLGAVGMILFRRRR